MDNINTTRMRCLHPRAIYGFVCHVVFLPVSTARLLLADTRFVPFSGTGAHRDYLMGVGIGVNPGRIVSISRGSPPPRRR